jgi:hypothetical protein
MRELLKYSFLFLLVLAAQVLFFDRLILPGGFVISFYIYFIMILPFNINRILLMLVALIMGIGIESFNDTFGLHASAAVFLAWIRPFIYKGFEPIIGYGENQTPNLAEMGWAWTIKTYFIAVFAFNVWLYALSFLRIIGPWFTLQKVLFSTFSTLIVILVVQVLYRRKMNKNEL